MVVQWAEGEWHKALNLNKSVCQSTLNKTFRLQEHDFKGWLSKSGNSIWRAGRWGQGLVKVKKISHLPSACAVIRKIHEIDYYNIIYFSLRITDGETKLGGKSPISRIKWSSEQFPWLAMFWLRKKRIFPYCLFKHLILVFRHMNSLRKYISMLLSIWNYFG